MKTRSIIFQTLIALVAVTCSIQTSFAQSAKKTQSTIKLNPESPFVPAVPPVAIKVYERPDGKFNLLVFSPTQHSLDFFNDGNYQITWTREGYPLNANSNRVNDICGDYFQVTIVDYRTGAATSAEVYGLTCPIND